MEEERKEGENEEIEEQEEGIDQRKGRVRDEERRGKEDR